MGCASSQDKEAVEFSNVEGRLPGPAKLRALVKGAIVTSKGAFNTNQRGDCPFCHRVLLTIAEKGIDHTEEYIDLHNKPALFADNNFEATPVIQLTTGEYANDSSDIAALLEEKFPSPSLKPPLAMGRGAEVFTGTYHDPLHMPGSHLVLSLVGKRGEAKIAGGGGDGEPASYELPALIEQSKKEGAKKGELQITVDFTNKGGPKGFVGYWDENGIKWPPTAGQKKRGETKGNFWPKTSSSADDIGKGLFGSFVKLLKSKVLASAAKTFKEAEKGFLAELGKLEAQLARSGGPYLCGAEVCSVDLNVAPKLKHASVALPRVAEYPLDRHMRRYAAVREYLRTTMPARPSWGATFYDDRLVANGWGYHANDWRAQEGLPPLPHTGAVGAAVFAGTYHDPLHMPGSHLVLSLVGKRGEAKIAGGGGDGEPASYELPALIEQSKKEGAKKGELQITVDFTNKGGPKGFVGYWDENGIKWPPTAGQKKRGETKGNFWPKEN